MALPSRYADAAFAFAAATAIAAILTPLAARLARRVGAMSYPKARGLSERPTPLLGGLAILAGVAIAAYFWMPATIGLSHTPHGQPGSAGTVHTWWVLAGGGLIALVGALDDVLDLKWFLKLAGQVGVAVIAVKAGAVITNVTIPFVGPLQFTDTGGPITVIWLVALMNIVNFSDGVDGLAAGVCTIDAIAFAVIAFDLQGPASAAAVLAALTAGGALGFLFHNFYPAKVFMGDSGANLLGYLLGVVAVIGSIKTSAVVALALPLLILAVPFLDTGFVVAKRLKYGKKPWDADAEHFHHRMARIGFSPRKTVAYLYTWTLMLAGLALALRFVPYSGYSHHHHHYNLVGAIVMGVILLLVAAASVYLVFVLEIFKFRGLRVISASKAQPEATEPAATQQTAEQTPEAHAETPPKRDVGTGEFEVVRH